MSGVANDMAAALFESAESDVGSRTLRMTNFPAAWVYMAEDQLQNKILNLLKSFGKLDQAPSTTRMPEGTVVAIALFKDAKAAETACKTLHDVDNRTASDKRKSNNAAPKESDKFSVVMLGNGAAQTPSSVPATPTRSVQDPTKGSAEAYDPEGPAAGAPDSDGLPYLLCVDEVRLASGEPSQADREIYLRDLPLKDYNEQQLRDWLRGFGQPEQIIFLKDPATKQMTGKGYVRFGSHEEAAGLLAAFPAEEAADEDSDDGGPGVQGSWSLSERLLLGSKGRLRADVCHALAARLTGLLEPPATCSNLLLVGGGRGALPAALASCNSLEALTDGRGPLHVAAWPREALLKDPAPLKKRLAALLDEALADPVAFSGAAARGPAQETSGIACAAQEADATPASPCIVLRGFPASWKEQQVRLVFALFGGVAAVHFVPDDARGRVAHVALKNAQNMPKAVEQLNGTKVGDGELIEECTVQCELFGADDLGNNRPVRRVIFLDELTMSKRPDLKPDNEDKEVFLSCLPIKDFTEGQIKVWLDGFGRVDEVCLLRDHYSGQLNGKGYVQFASHREAAVCIQAQASAADAEEGDVIAWWSESERAARSAYGLNLHSSLAGPNGRVVAPALEGSRVREVWMLSKSWVPKDAGTPALQGKQVHFVAQCTDQEYEELRGTMSVALQTFHERAAGGGKPEEGHGGSSSSTSRAGGGEPAKKTPAWGAPPKAGASSWSLGPSGPPPAAGGTAASPFGAPWGAVPSGDARPPWAMPGFGPGPPGPPPPWGWPRGPLPPNYNPNLPPPGLPPPPPPPPPANGHATAPASQAAALPSGAKRPRERDRERARRGQEDDVEKDREMAKQVTQDPAAQDLIVKGEQLVRSGKAASEKGNLQKAYEKFYQGLQVLLSVISKLGDGPAVSALKARIHSYMDETERLKRELDRIKAEAEAPAQGAQDAADEGDSSLDSRIKQGERLVLAGQKIERGGDLAKANDKYCDGLKILIEVMQSPELAGDDAYATKMRSKISGYLEQAEVLKEKLERERSKNGVFARDEDSQQADGGLSRRRRRREPSIHEAPTLRSPPRSPPPGPLAAPNLGLSRGPRGRGKGGERSRDSRSRGMDDRSGDYRRGRRDSWADGNGRRRVPSHERSGSRSGAWPQERERSDLPLGEVACRPKTSARAPVLRPKSAAKPIGSRS